MILRHLGMSVEPKPEVQQGTSNWEGKNSANEPAAILATVSEHYSTK